MTTRQRPGSDTTTTRDEPTSDQHDEPTSGQHDEPTSDRHDGRPEGDPTGDRALALRVDADRLAAALAGAGAIVEECLCSFEDGLHLRARDPADVVMAAFDLPASAFETYTATGQRFGVPLERFRNAVSMADSEPVAVTLDDRDRLCVDAGPVEYALAPIDPRAVRNVEWLDDRTAAARAVLDAAALRRAVRATDLVADHATMTVDADAGTLAVTASGDTDDVRIDFGEKELVELDPGPVDSIYSLDYLQQVVGVIPSGGDVEVEFLDTAGREGRPLALTHSFADGVAEARWLLAPRLKR